MMDRSHGQRYGRLTVAGEGRGFINRFDGQGEV